jgi:hypothetical protein
MAMLEELYNDGKVQGELMDLPGFRFYPTEEELVGFYLKKRGPRRTPTEPRYNHTNLGLVSI